MRTDAHLSGTTRPSEEGFPSPEYRLGNDVVDLRHRACRDRSPDDRLVERILTAAEREWLETIGPARRSASFGEPALPTAPWLIALWALWAAKETAFKVVSKRSGPPEAFRHRGFECSLAISPAECRGLVRIRGKVRGSEVPGEVSVEGSSDGEHVHLVGWSRADNSSSASLPPTLEMGLEGQGDRDADLEGYRPLFSGPEWEGIRTVPAAEARLRARARLAAYLGGPGGGRAGTRPGSPGGTAGPLRIEILTSGERPGRTPPRIRVNGTDRPDLDLSLSHHGRFVAWALLVPEPDAGAGP